MESRTSLKWSLFIVCIGGIAVFLTAIFITSQNMQNLINDKSDGSIQGLASLEQASSGLPLRLKIPGLDLDSAVEYVGFDSNGAMDVPKERANVAWFKFGPRPGKNGSAVIAGHYGWKDGKGSVFDNLYTLHKGDIVYVEDDRGKTVSFVVRGTRRYDPKADASDIFISNDGKSHLNLITCEGIWDNISKTYPERLVVFTDKE